MVFRGFKADKEIDEILSEPEIKNKSAFVKDAIRYYHAAYQQKQGKSVKREPRVHILERKSQ